MSPSVAVTMVTPPRRLRVLRSWIVLLPAGGERLQTSGSPARLGGSALRRVALPEVRSVRRRLAERRQRAFSHQHPEEALRGPPRGRSALVRIPG